jgi:predicted NAD-dependent protein-ADP-ribosyltransferase YbiA (DUF1768 family)
VNTCRLDATKAQVQGPVRGYAQPRRASSLGRKESGELRSRWGSAATSVVAGGSQSESLTASPVSGVFLSRSRASRKARKEEGSP